MSSEGWRGWQRTRARGEAFFVWVHGVLGWGVPMSLLWTFYHGFYETMGTPWYVIAGIAMPIFTFGGYCWGKFMWRSMERKYSTANKQATG